MLVKDRRSGIQSWVPWLFASFWILLAAFSGWYLYTVVTNPVPHRVETAVASPPAAPTPAPAPPQPAAPPPLTAEQAQALLEADEAKDKELSELRSEVRGLSSQVADLSARLRPLEKVLGPVAALPSSTAVTISPPAPGALRPVERPAAPKPAAEAKPADSPKPEELPSVHSTTPEKPPEDPSARSRGTVDSPERKPAETSTPAAGTTDKPDETAPGESTETAAVNPPSSIPPGTTRFGIEIGSVDKQDAIRPMWRDLLTNHAALVAGLQARRIIAPDKKWRLIAGPFSSAAEAMQACVLFKKANMPCEATVFAGDSF